MTGESVSESAGNVRIVRTDELWIEGTAVDQLRSVGGLEGVLEVVGLPDLQPGRGYPVGSVALTLERLIPILIDKDIGCGMLFASIGSGRINPAKLEKKLQGRFFEWQGIPVKGQEFRALLERPALWPGFLAVHFPDCGNMVGQHAALAYGLAVVSLDPLRDVLSDESLESSAQSVGSIGQGNHFIEIQKIAGVRDPEAAERFGLRVGDTCITIHSGSRSFGYSLAECIFREAKETGTGKAIPPDSPLWDRYLAMMQAAVNYAALNRLVLLLRTLEYTGESPVSILLDRPHNFAEIVRTAEGKRQVVHRKGAAPAHYFHGRPDPVLIPGSMGNESWFCVAGEGVSGSLNSVNHGVGRKWQRSVAVEKLQRKARERGMRSVTGRGAVVCGDETRLFEEGGDAYKNVETVMDCAEKTGLICRVARLEPLLTMRE